MMPFARRFACLLVTVIVVGCAEEERPRFAPHGLDAGQRDAGEYEDEDMSQREGGTPAPVSGISTRAFEKMLEELAAIGGDLHDPDRICAGIKYGCAINAKGEPVCWGGSESGHAVASPDLPPLKEIACAGGHACALDENGKVWCWGGSQDKVPNDTFVRIASFFGTGQVCALKEDGEVKCWGAGFDESTFSLGFWQVAGENAFLRNSMDLMPPPPPVGKRFSQISVGAGEACGVELDTGAIICWPQFSGDEPPEGKFVEIAVGGFTKCARDEEGQITCWGAGTDPSRPQGCIDVASFECGQGVPPPLPPGTTYQRIRMGGLHSCAIRSNYTGVCWGMDLRQIAEVPPLEQFAQIAPADTHTCAYRTNGSLKCWGDTTNDRIRVPKEWMGIP